jgi:uncharacterized protein (DUF2147 family)
MRRTVFLAAFLFTAPLLAQGSQSPLLGNWREPGGSIIRIAPCGSNLCATLVAISPQAPSHFDIHNPDPKDRSHKLCGLVIGHNFQRTSPTNANNGILYDPKTGKTYHGEMTVTANNLDLRGYIGIPLFGRSQTWTRTTAPAHCPAR